MLIDENQSFGANFKAITHYLDNFSIVDDSISITPELWKKAKDFLVHDERLFRLAKYGIRFVLVQKCGRTSSMDCTMKSGIGTSIRHMCL